MRPFTPFESVRREAVEAGFSTLARLHRGADDALIAWAQETGRYVYIGMETWQGKLKHPQSPWGNPYHNPRYGSLGRRLALYARHLDARDDLLARLPELRGKVLCCWCAPAWCHGEVLLQRLQGEYQEWLDNLPESLQDTPLAEKLQEVCELDLEALDIDLPRGFGRD